MNKQPTDLVFSASRLREARELAGLSREAVAAACGCSVPTVGNWEAGRTEPDAGHLGTFAAVTGKPLDWFWVPGP